MSLAFVFLAALMAAAAVACLLVPLLRKARSRPPLPLAIAVCIVLPFGALGLYAWIGTPAALSPTTAAAAPHVDLASAVQRLRAHLKAKPGDAQGWLLLARSYHAMQQDDLALGALAKARKLKPNDPDIMVAYVETASLQSDNHRIDGKARALLTQALKADPTNQHGLWLLGISDYQRGDFAAAASTWRRLLPLLQPGSNVAAAVTAQIARADQAGGVAAAGSVATAAAAPTPNAAPAARPASHGPAGIEVRVSVAPALRDSVSADATVFVFAHAIDGPPMPLAVTRLQASQLPATVELTDAMAMAPQLKLSMFPRVSVSARISRSGNALPHSGDLQAAAADVAVDGGAPVALSIDHRLP